MSVEAGRKNVPNVDMPAFQAPENGRWLSSVQNPLSHEISRRDLLKLGAAGAIGLTLGDSLRKLVSPEASKAAETVLFTRFEDVSENHPYFEAIMGMKDAGIIDGYLIDGKYYFKPEDSVKRAQFAKMIDGVAKLPVSEADVCNFTDVEKPTDNLYPDNYIAVAAKNGITKGITTTTFGPYEPIKRTQAVTMAIRANENLMEESLQTPPSGFKAQVDPSGVHSETMRKAEWNGLLFGLEGYSPMWDAWQATTRGEISQILWNLMTFKDREQSGEDFLRVTTLTKNQLPEQVRLGLDKYPSDPTRIKQILAGHPVNSSREIAFYLARTEGPEHKNIQERYIAKIQDSGNYLVTNYFPTFVIVPSMFKAYLSFDYVISEDNKDAAMSFELSGQFGRQSGESEAQYKNRILNLTSQIESEHGQDDVVRPEEVSDLLKTHTEKVYFYNYPELIVYDRAQGQSSAIEKLIDSL